MIINNKTIIGKNEFGQIYVIEEKIYERNIIKADRQATLLSFKVKDLKYDSNNSPYANHTFLHNKRYLSPNQYLINFHMTIEDKYDISSNFFVTYLKNMLNNETIIIFESILKLFDSNIEYIKFADNNETFKLKLKRYEEQNITLENLSTILSDGTRRGARLFIQSF